MLKFTSTVMNIFSYISYLVFLNLLWLLFTIVGGFLFGIAPATASLIFFVKELREKRNFYGIRDFWNFYKDSFLKTNCYFLFIGLFSILLLFNIRLVNLQSGKNSPLIILYLALGVLSFFITWNLFLNIAKNPKLTIKENFSLSLFMLTRFPHLNLANAFTAYIIWIIISQKSALILLCGMSIICFFSEYFHSRMIIKTIQLKRQWDKSCLPH